MCGIAGFFEESGRDLPLKIELMTRRLAHRGPDDRGTWIDAEGGLALGHTRLAIVDLSPQGHQPMVSASGRYVIVFNGEVYNFRILAQELETRGHSFKGGSDTEVMLAAFDEWGVEQAVRRFIGMFAFGLWDTLERRLFLVRDRLGIKPLYYGWADGVFLFGSELKALTVHPRFRAEIDRSVLALYMRHGYVPAPYSIYRGIFKLQPGWILPLDIPTLAARPGAEGAPPTRPIVYWSVKEAAERGAARPFSGSERDAEGELETLLRDAVSLRMIADVPLGAFLSGGIDSSLVVSLMQAQSSRPVRTFSIGFHETGYDEATYARQVAQHLRTEHTELYVTPKESMAVIPKLPSMFDEPFADSSQIPTYLVSELARRHVTVSLSGDGGDELFGGYPRYRWGASIWNVLRLLPQPIRALIASVLGPIPGPCWDNLGAFLGRFFPDRFSMRDMGGKAERLLGLTQMRSFWELYQRSMSMHDNPLGFVVGAKDLMNPLLQNRSMPENLSLLEQMMFIDTITYLPDDILTKVDRASMAVALEARVPLIDHRVVEFAWSLPLHYRARGGQSKIPLRAILNRYVPAALVERPKMGFGVPIDRWLKTDLKEWAEDLLNEDILRKQGYLNPEMVRKTWQEHQSGRFNRQAALWTILMFQAWVKER